MDDLAGKYPVAIKQHLVWGDMDAFQHINNTVYFRYFEDARITYFEKIKVIEYMQAHQIGPILASTSCNFRAPLAYPGTIQVAAMVKNIEKKSFVMQYKVYSEELSKIAAEGEGLIVYYDYRKGKSCEIPKQILSNLQRLESGNFTDNTVT